MKWQFSRALPSIDSPFVSLILSLILTLAPLSSFASCNMDIEASAPIAEATHIVPPCHETMPSSTENQTANPVAVQADMTTLNADNSPLCDCHHAFTAAHPPFAPAKIVLPKLQYQPLFELESYFFQPINLLERPPQTA